MNTSTSPAGKKTVADIWIEVQAEQRRFNRVIRYLTAALLVAAIVAGVAAFLSLAEFQNLRESYKEQIEFSVAKSAVQNAGAEQDRQAMRIELIALKEENGQNRIFAKLPRQTDRALIGTGERSNRTLEELVVQAMEFAKQSASGDLRLNTSTSYLIESVLEFNEKGNNTPIFTEDEAVFLQTALLDWQQPTLDDTRLQWRGISSTSNNRELRGYAHAALAHFHHRNASNASPRLGWEQGCRQTTELIRHARSLEVDSISLGLAAGSCLRKNGDYEEAFRSFVDALSQLARRNEFDGLLSDSARHRPTLKFRIDASHGAGTTLIPFAISLAESRRGEREQLEEISAIAAELPVSFSDLKSKIAESQTILEVSESFLTDAIHRRTQRNEGEIGELGTKENLGYLYLAQNDWMKALSLARDIDERMARPWNLVVYAIALHELELENTDEYRSILRKIHLMSPRDFDVAEMQRLLSRQQRATFENILSRAVPRETGIEQNDRLR